MESYEAEELGRYTSLSSLAVFALLLGLASPVALFAPLLAIVPAAGILCALFALVRINSSAGGLSGRKLAYWGLALSVVCVVAAPLRLQMRDSLYGQQADEAARHWLELVSQNQTEPALDYISGNARMGLSGPPPAEGPPPVVAPEILAVKLSQDTLVSKLQEEAKHGELEFATRALSCDTAGPTPRAAVKYQTVKPDDSLTMNLVLLRSAAQKTWLIDSWNLEGETAHSHDHSHGHQH
jgi:hypothetical protein